MDYSVIITTLYPTAILNVDYYISNNNDGNGVIINNWNTTKLGTAPTIAYLTNYYNTNMALPLAQAAQISMLQLACRNTIINGFPCSALGSSYTYPNKNTEENPDQVNMASSVLAAMINASVSGWTTPMWCQDNTGTWVYANHTSPQVMQVATTGKTFVVGNQTKLTNLITQVNNATTVAAVQAIVW